MASGRFLLAATLSIASCATLTPVLCAQESSQSEPNRRILGEVNANNVYVRSRASEDAYATKMLKKGDHVTVVGEKGNWLKIEPPEGSFAYIPKSFVNMRNDGTVGRMTKDWIARTGSDLNELAAEPMAQVHQDEDVQIMGQYHEYFKIKPPAGSCLWINKQFVDPVKALAPEVAQKPADEPPAQQPEVTPAPANPKTEIAQADTGNATAPTTRPAEPVADSGTTAEPQPPATQPAKFDAVAEYGKLEKQFAEINTQPILQQSLPELLAGYQKVLDSDDLPVSMRRVAEIRVASLKVRNDARDKFLALQKGENEMAQKQKALLAERQEIEDRIKQNDLEIFAAVGTLRTSSLQLGQGTLYRLTDPATGRTVCYVRTTDPKYAGFLGQFIGVKGTASTDSQLKAIVENPVDVKTVEPSQVNVKIVAQFVPPSVAKFAPARPPAVTPQEPAVTVAPANNTPATVSPANPGNTKAQASTGEEPQ